MHYDGAETGQLSIKRDKKVTDKQIQMGLCLSIMGTPALRVAAAPTFLGCCHETFTLKAHRDPSAC